MFSALTKRSFAFRLNQAFVVRSIAINKQRQQYQPKQERLHILSDKSIPYPCNTTTVLDSLTSLSIRSMSSTPSTINLQALGNNFVKTVPTMEVKY